VRSFWGEGDGGGVRVKQRGMVISVCLLGGGGCRMKEESLGSYGHGAR
jgi:hypothetical protein